MIQKRKKFRLIGLILILIGSIYLSYKFFIYVKIKKLNEENIITYFKQYNNLGNQLEVKSEYLMVLEIPKLNLKQGIYNKNDIRNTIEQNVSILNESIKIDNQNSLLILAAHSGNSIYSYFRNLSKLSLNDMLIIYYEGKRYIYKINNIYQMKKTIDLKLLDIKNNKIVLVTCLDDDTYLIIEAMNT
ncbi:MAG: sortase [Bacilli bacterium]|nr:sortase [Bacilli bacterium]